MDLRSHDEVPAVVKLHDAGDVVAMVPYLVGYRPDESLVVLGLTGRRQRVGPVLRVDLPPEEHLLATVDQVAGVFAMHRVPSVFVVCFSVCASRADPTLRVLVEALGDAGVGVVDAVRADGARWWRADEPGGRARDPVSAAGVPYDPGCMRVSAEAVAAGLTYGADRDESRRMFRPDPKARAEVVAILDRMRDRPAGATGERAGEQPAVLALVQHATSDGDHEVGLDDVARLGLAAAEISSRDVFWVLMERTTARAHLQLWARVARAMPDRLLPGPATLAGFAAWLAGDGTVARHAVERVLEVAPEYSMARLLEGALDRFLDPRAWDSVLAGHRLGG
jgi:hypothetical protein